MLTLLLPCAEFPYSLATVFLLAAIFSCSFFCFPVLCVCQYTILHYVHIISINDVHDIYNMCTQCKQIYKVNKEKQGPEIRQKCFFLNK